MRSTTATLFAFAAEALGRVREQAPLVQCLTNSVVASFTANALLATSATPAIPGRAGGGRAGDGG